MAVKPVPIPVKVAIYQAIVSGESGRSVASRFGISHPTALKYADEAVVYLVSHPAVQADNELVRFFGTSVKMQVYSYEPAIADRLLPLVKPILDEAEALLEAPGEVQNGPTLSISSRVPESLFYQFRRLAVEVGKARGQEVTISSLLAELVESYVESGKAPMAETTFPRFDLLMDDVRAVFARYGIVND